MQEKYKGWVLKFASFVPSIIVVFSLVVFYGRRLLGVQDQMLPEFFQMFLNIWLWLLLFSLFVVLAMMVAFVLHVVIFNKKLDRPSKLVWIIVLWVLNALAIPVYYLKYLNNKEQI